MKLITTGLAAVMIAAVAMPTLAEAKKRHHGYYKHQRQHHWSSRRCANGFNGVDCSTVSARDPDRRLSRQIISDFRRGVDTPGNGR